MSDNSIEIYYDIKAMFTEAYQNPQFSAFTTGIIESLLSEELSLNSFIYNGDNRIIEISINSKNNIDIPKTISITLNKFVNIVTNDPITSQILCNISIESFFKLRNIVNGIYNTIEVINITNYLFSILNMGVNDAGNKIYRIMM